MNKSLIFAVTTLFLLSSTASANYIIKFTSGPSKGMIPKPEAVEPLAAGSCKEILDSGNSTGDGVYSITVNENEFNVYCDMTSAGGGWTMVVAQFEQDPVANWNEGIQADYDPSLIAKKGFALNSQELPQHTQTAFGKSLDADFIDYVNYTYSTFNLVKTSVTGLNTNINYHIHRSSSSGYSYCNPENGYSAAPWINALTFDKIGSNGFDWCFFPETNISPAARGYSLSGNTFYYDANPFAWTVWVR